MDAAGQLSTHGVLYSRIYKIIQFSYELSHDILENNSGLDLVMNSKATLRTDIINISTAFLRSAFNGLRSVKNDKSILAGGMVYTAVPHPSPDRVTYSYSEFPSRSISAADIANAELLATGQPRLNFSVREGRVLYLKAYCQLSWKKIGDQYGMSWSAARTEYDEAAIKLFLGLLKDREPRSAVSRPRRSA